MSISPDAKRALDRMGMTGYEIKLFMSLLRRGEQTARSLSDRTGVPYSRIYAVLESLKTKGCIESDNSRPTNYFARSPQMATEAAKQRLEVEFAESQRIIQRELTPIYEKSGTRERPDVWVLTGALNIASKMLELVESCRNEVLIALPEAGQMLVKQALPRLRALRDRNVDITILTSDRMDTEALRAGARIANIKIRKGLFGGGIISDHRYVVILLGSEVGSGSQSTAVAIWADHPGLARFAREYFEYLLKDSEDVAPPESDEYSIEDLTGKNDSHSSG